MAVAGFSNTEMAVLMGKSPGGRETTSRRPAVSIDAAFFTAGVVSGALAFASPAAAHASEGLRLSSAT